MFVALHDALQTEQGNVELEWVHGVAGILGAACGFAVPTCLAGTAGRR